MDPTADSQSRSIRVLPTCIVLGFLVFGVVGPKLISDFTSIRQQLAAFSVDALFMFRPTLWMLAVLLGCLVLRWSSRERTRYHLGLRTGWTRAMIGVAFGLLCTLPMGLLAIWCDPEFEPRFLAYSTIVPGVTEEVLFRAFGFGLLVQVARWRVWPAAIVTGIIFGLAHIDITPPEGTTILGQIFTFWIFMISLGGVLYAWLFYRSGWNLWIPIALHVAMNMWWDTFDLTSSPLGGGGATGARIATVTIAVTTLELVRNGVLRGPCSNLVARRDR